MPYLCCTDYDYSLQHLVVGHYESGFVLNVQIGNEVFRLKCSGIHGVPIFLMFYLK